MKPLKLRRTSGLGSGFNDFLQEPGPQLHDLAYDAVKAGQTVGLASLKLHGSQSFHILALVLISSALALSAPAIVAENDWLQVFAAYFSWLHVLIGSSPGLLTVLCCAQGQAWPQQI